jgi:hypothetical protein
MLENFFLSLNACQNKVECLSLASLFQASLMLAIPTRVEQLMVS